MKKLLAIVMLCISVQAGALELDGVKFEDKVQLGNAPLVLNGAGIRSAVFWDVYAAGLYLGEKKNTAAAVFADSGAKRLALYVMKENDTKHFLDSLRKGIAKNYDEQQAAAFNARLEALGQLFAGIDKLNKADLIDFDWLPAEGLRVSLNGKELGKIEGADFYQALLAIWIGDKPAKDKLKRELLGA
jgi:hypothetical protein